MLRILAAWLVCLAGAADAGVVRSADTCEARLAASERDRSRLTHQAQRQAARIKSLEDELRAWRSGRRCPEGCDSADEPLAGAGRPASTEVAVKAPAPDRLLTDDEGCDFIYLYSQADVDAFQHNTCARIYILEINQWDDTDDPVTNLRGIGLAGPKKILWSWAVIYTMRLESLEGLGNLSTTEEVYIYDNRNLTSLTGINLSTATWLQINDNPMLPSLDGLQDLTLVDGTFRIADNAGLLSLHGLGNLSRISGKLEIYGNNQLASLGALGSLTHAWGGVRLENNGLRTLEGLNKLEVARHVTIAGDSRLEVLGGLFSTINGTLIGKLSISGAVWPRCITPAERSYLSRLRPMPHLGMTPEATWESWLNNSCGPGQLLCWIGLPCEADLTGSNFTGDALLTDRTCGPCQHSTVSVRAGATATLADLSSPGLAPGIYTLCRCGSGDVGAGPVAALSVVGPRRGQHFHCVRGHECSLHVLGHGLSLGDVVALMDRCGAAEAPRGQAVKGGDGEYRFADLGAMAALPPNLYKLCWTPPCSNASGLACKKVEIGSLRITGPFVRSGFRQFAVGETLTVANLGDGVDEHDRLRLLRQCGQPGAGGIQVESGKSMIFSLALDASWARAHRYRKCWCKRSPLTPCNASEHFIADSGAVQVVCPAEMEPTETGECRKCPIGRARSSPGLASCALHGGYVLMLASYSSVLCLAFITLLAATKRSMRIEDVSVVDGRTLVKTLRPHGLKMHGRASFAVRFRGTAHPGLEMPAIPFRACRSSPQVLELLAPGGGPPDERLDTSRGFISVPVMQELWHRGWPAPAALQAPLLVNVAFLLLLSREQQTPNDVTLGAAAALLVAAVARLAIAMLPETTSLDRRIKEFRRGLLKANPQPLACEKGPQRAIEVGQLFRVMEFFHAFIRDRSAYYMDGNIFGPLTKVHRLSYAELVGPQKVEWFVSHFWGDSFSHLCGSLQKHAEWASGAAAWQQTAYWICFISNNQYQLKDELGSSWRESSFFVTLQSGLCRGVCMVLDDLALPLTRSWCIFELLQTLRLERSSGDFSGLLLCTSGGVLNLGQGSVEVAMNLCKRIATLDLENARASCESDKVMINDQVMQELGSFESMNGLVRQKMHSIISKAQENANESFDRLFALLGSSMESKGKEREEDDRLTAVSLSAKAHLVSRSEKVHVDI